MNAKQSSLFDYKRDRYPDSPGYKTPGTSKDAAKKMKRRAKTLKQLCFETIEYCGDLTPDEVADILRESVLSIRPRISELAAEGRIIETGKRRANESGMMAASWRVK